MTRGSRRMKVVLALPFSHYTNVFTRVVWLRLAIGFPTATAGPSICTEQACEQKRKSCFVSARQYGSP